MPSREQSASSAEAAADSLLASDVEQLVCEIKENLRLAPERSASKRAGARAAAAPYAVRRGRGSCGSTRPPPDDPYERLQELLRDGDLIKEAVRRLTSTPHHYHPNVPQKACDPWDGGHPHPHPHHAPLT